MNSSFDNRVRYVTNAAGETTDVLVPLELWEQIVSALPDPASGLAWIDEGEPKAEILADLQASLKEGTIGQTFPVAQLWDEIET